MTVKKIFWILMIFVIGVFVILIWMSQPLSAPTFNKKTGLPPGFVEPTEPPSADFGPTSDPPLDIDENL